MELFGIGPMELILILIVALMVFGPDKLPQIGAKLGRAMREMRKATRAISDEINTTRAAIEAPAKELAEPFQDLSAAAKSAAAVAAAARNPGQTLRDSVLRELNTAVDPEAPAAATATVENTIAPPQSGKSGPIDSAPVASVAPEPLAALPAPEELIALPAPDELAALPAPEEPIALPAPEETVALPAPEEPIPPSAPENAAALPASEKSAAPALSEEPSEESDELRPGGSDSLPTTPEQ